MPFTARDFRDLARLLELHPEWRAELRRILLDGEAIASIETVERVVATQERTNGVLRRLIENVESIAARIEQLTSWIERLLAMQARIDRRFDRLEALLGQLALERRRGRPRRLRAHRACRDVG